jgi:TIR domain
MPEGLEQTIQLSTNPPLTIQYRHKKPLGQQMAQGASISEFEPEPSLRKDPTMTIKIFVSHSGKDSEIAKNLVQWIEGCLVVPSDTIRCTSVHGYKLSAGDTTGESLRRDLISCNMVLGLLTDTSLESAYVLMELGAAWALKKRVGCLLLPGISFSKIQGPIAGNHAIHLNERADLISLADTLSEETKFQSRNSTQRFVATDTFSNYINGLTLSPH